MTMETIPAGRLKKPEAESREKKLSEVPLESPTPEAAEANLEELTAQTEAEDAEKVRELENMLKDTKFVDRRISGTFEAIESDYNRTGETIEDPKVREKFYTAKTAKPGSERPS